MNGNVIEDKKIVKCRSCQADIFFIPIENGKKHPVNAKIKRIFVFLEELGWQLETGYESHFSTCVDAAFWRNKNKRKGINVRTTTPNKI